MAAETFTNYQSGGVLASTHISAYSHRAYASKGSAYSSLTDKERLARKIKTSAQTHTASGFGASGMGMSGNTVMSGSSSFFSPQIGPDFLQQPQSLREKREIYRHFYSRDPLVGQAVDLHSELPMSKVRLTKPTPRHAPPGFKSPSDYGKYILNFFMKMEKRIKLFRRLLEISLHYNLDGNVFIFAEDGTVEVPEDIGHHIEREARAYLDDFGVARESMEVVGASELPDREERELEYYQKNYKGWDKLIILPIDQIRLTSFSFTDKVRMDLIPSDRERALVDQANAGDETAAEMVQEIPLEVREHIEQGRLIPLGSDPDEGSFCYHLVARRLAGEDLGASILDRCLNTLYYREKLRQAQTMIADRSMTPKRLVWGENLSADDTEDLREQVDLSLVDPDYSIVTNYEVHWEEIGARDRLLDLSTEYEITDKQLYAGLGVTESLLNGESAFSGDRVKLEVLNTRYLLFREVIQEYVEEYLFKPVARRKGFVELDEWGEEIVLYPKLSFTRLALRDSQDTFDALFNLYQKGSISIDLILEMFNIDPVDTREKIENDMFTANDALFNEVIRGIYGEVGRTLADKSDVVEKIATYLKLKLKPEPGPEEGGDEGGGRY